MTDVANVRVSVAALIEGYVNGRATLAETMSAMPDLTVVRDPSIDSVDHVLQHLKLEVSRRKPEEKYLGRLQTQLRDFLPFLKQGKPIKDALLFKPFYN
jgi:hypothetical protein